jgi:GTP-binding protein EngB required for normal cell division
VEFYSYLRVQQQTKRIMEIIIEIRKDLKTLDKTHRVFSMNFNNEEDRQCAVDWEIHQTLKFNTKNVNVARTKAKKLSLRKDIYSVHIIAQDEDDPILQEFYENSKVTKLF